MRQSKIAAGLLAAACATVYSAAPARAAVVISEWMYDGSEFIELKNTGPSAANLTGWSYDDNTRVAGTLSLSGLGTLAVNEVALITQDEPANFRTLWGLPGTVKIVQNVGADNLLQRSDEINIYDATSTLIDRLTYNDQATGTPTPPEKGPRTNTASGNIAAANFGMNNASLAALSVAGDAYGSYAAPANATLTANPGNVPEPTGVAMIAAAGAVGLRRRRRRVDRA